MMCLPPPPCPECQGVHYSGGTGWVDEGSERGDPGEIGVDCPGAKERVAA